jgi:1-acyl-sn-glycerol-3-phosphate acyltransferase
MFAYSLTEVLITRPRTRPQRAAWLTTFCRRVLGAMNIRVEAIGPVASEGAVISNHLTFLDIIAHGALRPCVFVSKSEIAAAPVLGFIATMAGTVYVVRGGGGSAARAAEGMAKGFRDRLPVIFFPEGGTFDGDEPVMPFRTGLLAETLAADEPVTASFVSYTLTARDLQRGRTLREDVYLGERSYGSMAWRLAGLDEVLIHIRFAAQPIAFPPAAHEDRKIAAVIAREHVLELSAASAASVAG